MEPVRVATRAEFEDGIRRIGHNDPTVTKFLMMEGPPSADLFLRTLNKEDSNRLLVALSKNTHLVYLNLRCVNLRGDHARMLSEIIMRGDLPLTTLQLWKCNIRDDGAAALSKAIAASSSLTELHLHQNGISDLGAAAFAKALEINNTLEYIALGNDAIGNDGATALFGALEKNTALKRIAPYSNRIDCNAARAIAKALKKNTTISQIELSNNPIKANGAKELENAMRGNTTLTRLCLFSFKLYADVKRSSIVESIYGMTTRNFLLKSHGRGIEEFGTAFYVLRTESNRGKFEWATPQPILIESEPYQEELYMDEDFDFPYPKPIWETLTGDGMALELVLGVLSEIVNNAPHDVAALKALVESETNEHGDTLLHAAATKDCIAAVDLCLFLMEEVGVDAHGVLNQMSRSVFNVSDRKMPILKKMEFARLCRDARNADAYAGALVDIVEEQRGVESALYYLIQEKPEVANPTFWNASARGHA